MVAAYNENSAARFFPSDGSVFLLVMQLYVI
jgi:hypothetical protein